LFSNDVYTSFVYLICSHGFEEIKKKITIYEPVDCFQEDVFIKHRWNR